MDRDRLVMGLAAVFAGLTMLLVVLAFVYQPFLLFLAVPFGATTYFMYSHVSGRLEARYRAHRVDAGGGRVGFGASRGDGRGRSTGGFGAGPRDDPREGPGAGRFGDVGGRRVGGRGAGRRTGRRGRPGANDLTRAEALRTLELDADASADEVKRAYREKVKQTHPDSKTGDEDAFKRVTRAYDRLSE